MPTNDAMTALMQRMQQNAAPLQQSYNSANQLLEAAVAEAFPWVLSIPGVRGKVPAMFRNALPKGSPVSLEKLERLATQLVAILAASYGSQGPGPTGGDTGAAPVRNQANIYNFKEH